MTDTKLENISLKEAFDQQQANRTDMVLEEAQRLVNLYHHADSFGEDFEAKLDDMLLAVTPDVLSALSNILGGSVVRRYAEFLKEQKTPAVQNESGADDPGEASQTQTGYLPSPAEDEPCQTGSVAFEALFKAHQTELERLLEAQTETLAQVIKKVDQTTHDVASRQTDRLIHAIRQETGKQKQYSDVIESAQSPILVPDETEG